MRGREGWGERWREGWREGWGEDGGEWEGGMGGEMEGWREGGMGGRRSNTWFKGNKLNLTGTRIDGAIKSCVVSEHLHYCTLPMIRPKLSENVTFIVYILA